MLEQRRSCVRAYVLYRMFDADCSRIGDRIGRLVELIPLGANSKRTHRTVTHCSHFGGHQR
jgi:hypothetical protein